MHLFPWRSSDGEVGDHRRAGAAAVLGHHRESQRLAPVDHSIERGHGYLQVWKAGLIYLKLEFHTQIVTPDHWLVTQRMNMRKHAL